MPAPFGLLCAWREVSILRQQQWLYPKEASSKVRSGGILSVLASMEPSCKWPSRPLNNGT
jgi:hypothetical protein